MQVTNLKSDHNLSLLMVLNLYFHWIHLVEVTNVPKFPLILHRKAIEMSKHWKPLHVDLYYDLWPVHHSQLTLNWESTCI